MQDTFEVLQQRVLPAVKKGRCRVILRDALEPAASRSYIEAYPHDKENHSHYEWMWLLSGAAFMKVNGRIHPVLPGDLCFLPPQTPHADVYDRATQPYESLWFSHWPSVVYGVPFSYAPFGVCNIHQGTMAPSSPEMQSVLVYIHHELAERKPFFQDTLQGLMLHLVTLLLRSLENQRATVSMSLESPSAIGQISARVLHYLNDNYTRTLSLKDIGGALYLSPNYLATVFKRETGQTIFDTLTRIRIERALELLLHSPMPLHEIAVAVGYNNLDGFSRAFRQQKGFPPSRYQRPPYRAIPFNPFKIT